VGIHKQAPRPAGEWLELPAPNLQIVSDEVWQAAHARLEAVRGVYLKATNNRPFGRPALGDPSKYLLTNLASCGVCGGSLLVISSQHGSTRRRFYGCAAHRERGTCSSRRWLPMGDGDQIVIEALLDDVIDESIVRDAVDEAIGLLRSDDQGASAAGRIEAELARLTREHVRLMAAVTSGEQVAGLLEALRALDRRRRDLESQQAAIASRRPVSARDGRHLRDELIALGAEWRRVLADDPTDARPIVSSLLVGRVTFAALDERHRWRVTGEGTLSGLFNRIFTTTAVGVTSPTGFDPILKREYIVDIAAA
jgi:site-specific DNA recombinase